MLRIRVKCGMQNEKNQQRVKCGKFSAEYSAFYPLCHIRVSALIPVLCHRSTPSPCGLNFQLSLQPVDWEWPAGPPYHVGLRTLVRTVCSPLSVCISLSTTNARLYIIYTHTDTCTRRAVTSTPKTGKTPPHRSCFKKLKGYRKG